MKKIYTIFMVVFVLAIIACSKEEIIKEPTKEEKDAGWRYFKPIGFKLHRPAFFETYGDNVDVITEGDELKTPDELIYAVYKYNFWSDELNDAYDTIAKDEKLTREQKIEKIKAEINPKAKNIYALFTLRTPLVGNKKIEEITGYPNNKVIRKNKEFTQIFAHVNFNDEGLSEDSAKIYKEMISQIEPTISSITCTNPISPESEMMKIKNLKFDTLDLDGNKVTSDILAKYDVTMINIWATWCPPCVRELPEIGKLYEAFKDKGCNIIGITGDVTPDSQDKISKAKELIEKSMCKYTVLQYNDSLEILRKNLRAWPTTIFVDKHGNVIASTVNDIIVGGLNLEEFTKAMEKALKTIGK